MQAACQAANLATSNYTFVYLPVTYIQMLKSLSPALNFMVPNNNHPTCTCTFARAVPLPVSTSARVYERSRRR